MERDQTIIEWLEIQLENLSTDDRKRLILELAETLSGSHIREMRDTLDEMQQAKFADRLPGRIREIFGGSILLRSMRTTGSSQVLMPLTH